MAAVGYRAWFAFRGDGGRATPRRRRGFVVGGSGCLGKRRATKSEVTLRLKQIRPRMTPSDSTAKPRPHTSSPSSVPRNENCMVSSGRSSSVMASRMPSNAVNAIVPYPELDSFSLGGPDAAKNSDDHSDMDSICHSPRKRLRIAYFAKGMSIEAMWNVLFGSVILVETRGEKGNEDRPQIQRPRMQVP